MAQDFDPSVDIRGSIAFGRAYDPRRAQHEARPYVEYPKWVHVGEGVNKKSIIANNKAEEDKILGVVEVKAKPVSVDVSALGQNEPVPVQKRKYTKRAAPAELPKNLE